MLCTVHEPVLAGILPKGNNSQRHEKHEKKNIPTQSIQRLLSGRVGSTPSNLWLVRIAYLWCTPCGCSERNVRKRVAPHSYSTPLDFAWPLCHSGIRCPPEYCATFLTSVPTFNKSLPFVKGQLFQLGYQFFYCNAHKEIS